MGGHRWERKSERREREREGRRERASKKVCAQSWFRHQSRYPCAIVIVLIFNRLTFKQAIVSYHDLSKTNENHACTTLVQPSPLMQAPAAIAKFGIWRRKRPRKFHPTSDLSEQTRPQAGTAAATGAHLPAGPVLPDCLSFHRSMHLFGNED